MNVNSYFKVNAFGITKQSRVMALGLLAMQSAVILLLDASCQKAVTTKRGKVESVGTISIHPDGVVVALFSKNPNGMLQLDAAKNIKIKFQDGVFQTSAQIVAKSRAEIISVLGNSRAVFSSALPEEQLTWVREVPPMPKDLIRPVAAFEIQQRLHFVDRLAWNYKVLANPEGDRMWLLFNCERGAKALDLIRALSFKNQTNLRLIPSVCAISDACRYNHPEAMDEMVIIEPNQNLVMFSLMTDETLDVHTIDGQQSDNGSNHSQIVSEQDKKKETAHAILKLMHRFEGLSSKEHHRRIFLSGRESKEPDLETWGGLLEQPVEAFDPLRHVTFGPSAAMPENLSREALSENVGLAVSWLGAGKYDVDLAQAYSGERQTRRLNLSALVWTVLILLPVLFLCWFLRFLATGDVEKKGLLYRIGRTLTFILLIWFSVCLAYEFNSTTPISNGLIEIGLCLLAACTVFCEALRRLFALRVRRPKKGGDHTQNSRPGDEQRENEQMRSLQKLSPKGQDRRSFVTALLSTGCTSLGAIIVGKFDQKERRDVLKEVPKDILEFIMRRVSNIVASTLFISTSEVTIRSALIEDLGGDSLDSGEIVLHLEESFDIKIPEKDGWTLQTVRDIVCYLWEHIPQKRLEGMLQEDTTSKKD